MCKFRNRIEYIQKSGDGIERGRIGVNQTKGELTESYRGLPGYPIQGLIRDACATITRYQPPAIGACALSVSLI
jgi:hypothetical protein